MNNKDYLRRICEFGAQKKGVDLSNQVYRDRLNEELDLICDNDLEKYFLVTSYIVNSLKNDDILVGPSRGSSAGSLLCYVLDITNIDPIRFNLSFARFLNKARVEAGTLPDVDIDIPRSKREYAINFMREKFGEERVFNTTNFAKYKVKNTIKDIAKALGIDYQETNSFTSKIPDNTELNSLDNIDQSRYFFNKYPKVKYFLEKLQGINKNYGKHAGGIVIFPSDIENHMSTIRYKGTLRICYDKRIEDDGYIKVDLLGLASLDIIKDTIELANINLPTEFDDPKVFKTISNHPLGIFQLEEASGTTYLSKTIIDDFTDLSIALSAIRPGSAVTGDTERYIQYKANPSLIQYDHPDLKDILGETKGLIMFQEQQMEITKKFASFNDHEADDIRRAIGKKKMDLLVSYESQFMDNGLSNGYTNNILSLLWSKIMAAGDYSFNKSHAVGYAHISYYMGWLKTYYPTEFLISVANHSDAPKRAKIFNEMKQLGVSISNPDINDSEEDIILKDNNIILGLAQIEGMGDKGINNIISNRPYISFEDFKEKTNKRQVNSAKIESLIEAGAFDCFNNKNLDLNDYRSRLYYRFTKEEDRVWSDQEMLMREYKKLKLSPKQNLIDYYDEEVKGIKITLLNNLPIDENCDELYVRGLVNNFTPKEGYGYLEISDGTNTMTISVNQYLIDKYFDLFKSVGTPLLIKLNKSNEKYYMSFSIDLSVNRDKYKQQYGYIFNEYLPYLKGRNETSKFYNYGIIKNVIRKISKNGNDCAIITLLNGFGEEKLISCINRRTTYIPQLMASDLIEYKKTSKDFGYISKVL